MGEKAGDGDDLVASALSFRIVVAEPGKKGWAVTYGPYQSWLYAGFDCGHAIGVLQGKGTPTSWLRVEWLIGGKPIETKDLSDGQERSAGPEQPEEAE